MTAEYTEEPNSGYFNCWSGRHPKSSVRTLDLYMAWRDGEVFPALAKFPNLTALVLPAALLTAARVAEVARTNITSLRITMHDGPEPPAGVFRLPRLEALDLSGCGLTNLPDRFAGLPRLTRLELAHNELVALPPSVLASTSLTSLDLAFNRISQTPAFAQGSRLEQHDQTAAPLTALDVDRLPRGLTVLKAQAALDEVSSALTELVHLRVLALGNKLRELPDLGRLDRLESIELAGQLGEGLFDRLPVTLAELHGYGSHRVGIERIPPAIGRLTGLRVLDLPFEHITELAAELREVPLARLVLSSTRLADTPTYAHLPDSLHCLELANVGMTRCPPRLAELLELRELVLTANRLTEIPAAVRSLPRLTRLEADGMRR
jgi:leucine-rich repeat protein SHOC2